MAMEENKAHVSTASQTGGPTRRVSRASSGDAPIVLFDEGLRAHFEGRGVAVKARRGQKLDIDMQDTETLYLVTSGVLVLSADCTDQRRQLLMPLYPGDVFAASLAPPLDGIGLLAMTDSNLIRLRLSALPPEDADTALFKMKLTERFCELHARANLHIARLASLSSEARVAAFILEMALRMGRVSNDSVTCDLPLSRRDIADYLSLNADTLSRIMTRLKSRGIVATVGRSRAIIKSIKGLCADVPICAATLALHGGPDQNRKC
jgi:CRP/FNR family transcriptional regulator